MAKIPPLPAYLTKKDVQKLLEACEKFYAVELLGEGYQGYLATRWAIPALGYNWKNSREFFKDISALTQQDSAKDVYAVLSGWEGEAPLALPVQETQDISETVPRNLKELEEALDKAKSEKEKLALAKNYQFLKGKVAPETPKPETEPPTGEVPPKPEPAVSIEAKEAIPEVKEKAAPAVPAAAEGKAPPPEETFSVGIQITPQAGRVFQKFANRVASAPVRAAIAFAGPTIAAQQGGVTASALTLWARGIKSEPLEKEVSKLEAKEAKEFDGLIKAIKNIEASRSLQTRIIQGAFPVEKLSLVLKAGATQAQVNIFINPPEAGGVTAIPRRSFLGNLLVGAGQQLFGKLASKAISGLVSKATGAVAAGLGAPLGPVGMAIVYAVVNKIVSKVIGKALDFLREHRGLAYALGFLPVAGAGLLFGIPLLTVAGGLGVAVSLTGGTGAAVAGLGGALQGLFGALGSVFVTSIATPVLVALISIPVVVALILFIINSGAYVVPPSALSLSENPYVRVEKVATPAGPFQNSQIPVTVEYKITITALKGTLTNISFNFECEVVKEGSAPDCPPATYVDPDGQEISEGPQPGLTISPVNPFVVSYSATYSLASFRDSAIIDTLAIAADTSEEKGTKNSGSAAVIIGNPPTGCFEFTNDWPADARSREMAAIAEMSKARVFMTKLCRQDLGTITLDHEPQVARWGGWTRGYRYIVIYPLGVGNRSTALYTLSHESGHVLAQVTELYQRYLDTQGPGRERPICTYPVSGHASSEDFAEMVALYFSNRYGTPTSRFSCLGSQTFKTKYPLHWTFARNSIFLENLGW